MSLNLFQECPECATMPWPHDLYAECIERKTAIDALQKSMWAGLANAGRRDAPAPRPRPVRWRRVESDAEGKSVGNMWCCDFPSGTLYGIGGPTVGRFEFTQMVFVPSLMPQLNWPEDFPAIQAPVPVEQLSLSAVAASGGFFKGEVPPVEIVGELTEFARPDICDDTAKEANDLCEALAKSWLPSGVEERACEGTPAAPTEPADLAKVPQEGEEP